MQLASLSAYVPEMLGCSVSWHCSWPPPSLRHVRPGSQTAAQTLPSPYQSGGRRNRVITHTHSASISQLYTNHTTQKLTKTHVLVHHIHTPIKMLVGIITITNTETLKIGGIAVELGGVQH